MIEWLKLLKEAFGASFLTLNCLIAFTQGFKFFVWTGVCYHLKDSLELSPSAFQFIFSVASLPWTIQPLYGILSDCIPIRGRRRTPYLAISSGLSLLSWLILGLAASLRMSTVPMMMIFLTLENVGQAMLNVVLDAMVLEMVSYDRAAFAENLYLLSWMIRISGEICGCLLGGYAIGNMPICTIFILYATLPALVLYSCVLVEERPINTKDSSEDLSETCTDKNNEKSRRRNKKKEVAFLLKTAVHKLFHAFWRPIILRPMACFFLAQITFPNISTIMFYYQSDFLELDASFLGFVGAVGSLVYIVGFFIYDKYLRKQKLQKIVLWSLVSSSLLSISDMFLVSRARMFDKVLPFFGSALGDPIYRLKYLPFMISIGNLCPASKNVNLHALLSSIGNLGATISFHVGAGLISILNISSGSFDNLFLGLLVQFFCVFIPFAFLSLMPKDATGDY